MIGFKHHLPKYDDMCADWDPANRNEAQHILASITSFEFIVNCYLRQCTSILLTWLESLLSFREQLLTLWRPMK